MARAESKKRQVSPQERRLESTRSRITAARQQLRRSLFGSILPNVSFCEAKENSVDPYIASVDSEQGAITLNPHLQYRLTAEEWQGIIAHCLCHLAFGHGERCGGRDPWLWNIACDEAIRHFLVSLKMDDTLGEPDERLTNLTEEDIYDRLKSEPDLLGKGKGAKSTLAGFGKPDTVNRAEKVVWQSWANERSTDWAALLADGIRRSVHNAVREAAETLGEEMEATHAFPEAERARQWVLNRLPLLGPLAAQLKLITDKAVCDRRDIPVAAVDPYLGEIYMRPDLGMVFDEALFVYVHELLHVALLHHSRAKGRDPWLWNIACDFVINGWLVEMGIGRLPGLGGLYDPRLKNNSAEEVYDVLGWDKRRTKNLRGFRGALGDILLDRASQRIYRGDVSTLDDIFRRCISTGIQCVLPGTVPLGLLEEIKSLFTAPVDWDVELAIWMDRYVPILRDKRRSYARASRRQASTPDIPRAARFTPQEEISACTFGVVLDTSGSMDRGLLGRALGAIASYAEARDVPSVRLTLCDAAPYDRGYVPPDELRRSVTIQGRGGTVLQKGVSFLTSRSDFPPNAPIMILTDGWCEEHIECSREHCFVLPRKDKNSPMNLQTAAPVFRVMKMAHEE